MTTPPPPPPPGYGNQGYGAPGAPGYPAAREHPDGTTVLVLGILGLVACMLLAPFAWAKGNTVMREMDSQPNVYWSNRGSVTAGRICGIIGTVFILLGLAFFLLVVIAIAAGSSTS